jgi:F-type H+-transporting ATPase subunit b
MPQLEQISTYFSQVLWLAITFIALFAFLRAIALPKIAEVMDVRARRIADALEAASRLKSEAEAALAAYEKSMASAKDRARAIAKEAGEAVVAETNRRSDALAQTLAQRTRDAETRINETKGRALTEIRGMATDIALAATAKLIGAEPARASAERAVGRAIEERR